MVRGLIVVAFGVAALGCSESSSRPPPTSTPSPASGPSAPPSTDSPPAPDDEGSPAADEPPPLPQVKSPLLVAVGQPLSLFGQVRDAGATPFTYRWRKGERVLASGELSPRTGTAPLPIARPGWLPNHEVTLTLEVSRRGAVRTVDLRLQVHERGITGAELGLRADSWERAPLVRMWVVPLGGGGHQAWIEYAAFQAGEGVFSWSGFTYPGRNRASVDALELYLDRELVGCLKIPAEQQGMRVFSCPDSFGATKGEHVLTAVVYQGDPSGKLGRLAAAWLETP